ncbi:hypothetical protein [Mesorhizobium sp.]|uniref:maleate cis-trans isomerase family protein n=1 Tax=Mesorhizobium sp. TaxID=1871066 RepID=UPI000FE6BF2D|nr:hypothetical protein [Mesorhizobium sp.]RWP22880.1 MAG: hypothetical protein EOR02_33300 [Mesorhizobium sp.]
MQNCSSKKKIGAILLDDGKFPYEIYNVPFINTWLADHSLENAEYVLICAGKDTGDTGNATGVELCERATADDVLSTAARQLANNGCRSVVLACTSGSFFRGLQYAQRQIQLLSECAGAPASSTAMAFLAALDVLGAKRVDILSPYEPEITNLFVMFLSDAGVSVGSIRMYTPSGRDFDIDCEAELAELVSSTPFSDDPILIPCTAISSLKRVESFEDMSGRMVITANQVTLWHALVLAGLTPSIADSGSFFRSYAQMNHTPG